MVLDTLEQIKEDLVNETKEKVVEEGEEFKTKDLNRSVVVYPNINSTTAKVNYAAEVKKENTNISKRN